MINWLFKGFLVSVSNVSYKVMGVNRVSTELFYRFSSFFETWCVVTQYLINSSEASLARSLVIQWKNVKFILHNISGYLEKTRVSDKKIRAFLREENALPFYPHKLKLKTMGFAQNFSIT